MESKDFLHKLLQTPSPTGYEQPVQRLVRERMKKYADIVETDLHGNVIVGLNPNAKFKVMLAGHCDQIGLMIRHISSEGYLYFTALGGIDVGVLHAARVTIHSEKGPVEGVIGRKPIHHQTGDERDKTKNDIEKLWIDIGAKNKKEAEKKVALGDCATFQLQFAELGNDLITSPGLDDKVGLFIAMEVIRVCATAKLAVGLYSVSTVQEEIGLRGATTSAFGIAPDVGIALDVTHATDNPGNENSKLPPVKLGGGPAISSGPNTNPVLRKLLEGAAKKAKVPFQPAPHSRLLGNDANSIQVSRAGVATASIGIPNRYMHSPAEICSYKDLEYSIKLLATFVKGLAAKTDLRPM